MRRFLSLLSVIFSSVLAYSQDTLPKFNVNNLGNDAQGNARIVVGWVNNYDSLKQISIQTSHDSLKNYRTLISLTDPNAKLNGFADNNALNDHMFYRLFIVKSSGEYFFTPPKKPSIQTSNGVPITVTKNNYNISNGNGNRAGFVPSFYVYTNKDGYVFVNLPGAEKQKYHIKFYEEDQSFLFEIKNIKQTGLTLDKANFLHAGWFYFELYNDDKLLEKHKFYLEKDF
jgi:hypothetical protein